MSMRSSAGKRGAMEVWKAMWAVRVGVVVGRSLRKRRSLPVGGEGVRLLFCLWGRRVGGIG